MPTSAATTAPTTMAITSPPKRSAPHSETTKPVTAAPMAKKATCPRDTMPPHPASSTRDSPSTAYTRTAAALNS